MNLYSYFLNNTGRRIIKNAHYFPIYERYYSKYVNRPVTFLEIGTGEGGAVQMWKNYFGPYARIISLDIRPECKKFEEEQIHVRIGSQSDHSFLGEVIEEFGPPDIIMDDGSHHNLDINASFDFLYPRMALNGIYLAEDLNGSYWPQLGGGLKSPLSFIERCKGLVDELHARHTKAGGAESTIPESDFSRTTSAIHFYDSIIVFERSPYTNKELLYLPEVRNP